MNSNQLLLAALALTGLAPCLQGALPGPQGNSGHAPATVPVQDAEALAPGAGSYQVNLYAIDDGTTESSIGLVLGGTLCWFHLFDTRPGADFDVISEIQVAYGFPGSPGFGVPNGTPATVCVWEDPNDDGDPADAQLIATQATTVQGIDTHSLNSVLIAPVTVRRAFFAGVFLHHAQNRFPASRDLSAVSAGRSFFVGTVTLNGPFNPAQLAGVGHTTIFSLDTAGNPPGSLNSVWRVRALGQGPTYYVYCAGKVNSIGCLPQLVATGVPQASAFTGFLVNGTNVRNQKVGLLLYGTTGLTVIPFQGGHLCVNSPIKRSVSRTSGGSPLPASDCTGVYGIDMNAFAQGLYGGSPLVALLAPGTQVNCQWWGRDPGFPAPNNSTLTNALEYTIVP